ncbi:MAG: RNA polymerase sigma factor [Candidatus Omnitrophica bacterium]|nr:RNA polymerase sigma factor [Candidatus Omnitrophota bacterium]
MESISENLIQQATGGDREAFRRIYQITSPFVYTVALRTIGNAEDAAEVTQDVFVKLHRSLKNFEGRSSLKTWIYRITVNTAINHARRENKHRRKHIDYQKVPGEAFLADTTRAEIEKADTRQYLKTLLGTLPEEQRVCIILRELEDLSYEEIASTLKIKLNTVRTRLKRGREKLLSAARKEVITHEV